MAHGSRWLIRVVLPALVLVSGAGLASAETVNCTAITSVPFTISSPGIYCLTGNLTTGSTSAHAITINANNVVLDFNGHQLTNTAGTGTQAIGVFGHPPQRNITVKNGTIRGFYHCIDIEETFPVSQSRGHVVEDMHLELCRHLGLFLIGHASVVRNNVVEDTGGSTALSNVSGTGLVVSGLESRILNNDVARVTGSQGLGIEVGDVDTLVVNNRITNAAQGILFAGTATGKYRDNLTSNVATPFTGGTDAGNNN